MSHIARIVSMAAACLIAVSVTQLQAAPVETSRIRPAAQDTLKKVFGMEEVLALLSASATRTSSKEYLKAKATHLEFVETKRQGALAVDAYTALEKNSHIFGYRLFYGGEDGPLLEADAIVNRDDNEAISAAAKLIDNALDSVTTPDGGKTYFLGIQNLDASRVVKIMVRASGQLAGRLNYDIRYLVSKR